MVVKMTKSKSSNSKTTGPMDRVVQQKPKVIYLTTSDIKKLFTTAAASWIIEEAVPIGMFSRPTFCNMFMPFNKNAPDIVRLVGTTP